MSKHDDGGPAADKSLWAWFAGQAMAGLSANPQYKDTCEARAFDAFNDADAMIAEMRKREKDSAGETEEG